MPEQNLAIDVLQMCLTRGWSLTWESRGANLHLEASELIEAIRGKHGSIIKEAADVLIVLMSITESRGLVWNDVIAAAQTKVDDLKTRPRYLGESFIESEGA